MDQSNGNLYFICVTVYISVCMLNRLLHSCSYVVNSPVTVERRLMKRTRGNLVPAIKQITYLEQMDLVGQTLQEKGDLIQELSYCNKILGEHYNNTVSEEVEFGIVPDTCRRFSMAQWTIISIRRLLALVLFSYLE